MVYCISNHSINPDNPCVFGQTLFAEFTKELGSAKGENVITGYNMFNRGDII